MLGAGQDLHVAAVRCPFDTLTASASGVPVAVELLNSGDAGIEIQSISIYFTFISRGDRNSDYSVVALPPAGGLIPSGESKSYDFLVDVLDGVLTGETITVEAFAFGIRQDNLEQVTAGSYDTRMALDEFEVVSFDNNDGDAEWTGPWVEIGEADGPGGGLVVRIKDDGIGIPSDEIGKISEPFIRASNSKVADVRGMGLGLSVAQKIVSAHGARLFCKSARGAGAEFSIWFRI